MDSVSAPNKSPSGSCELAVPLAARRRHLCQSFDANCALTSPLRRRSGIQSRGDKRRQQSAARLLYSGDRSVRRRALRVRLAEFVRSTVAQGQAVSQASQGTQAKPEKAPATESLCPSQPVTGSVNPSRRQDSPVTFVWHSCLRYTLVSRDDGRVRVYPEGQREG